MEDSFNDEFGSDDSLDDDGGIEEEPIGEDVCKMNLPWKML